MDPALLGQVRVPLPQMYHAVDLQRHTAWLQRHRGTLYSLHGMRRRRWLGPASLLAYQNFTDEQLAAALMENFFSASDVLLDEQGDPYVLMDRLVAYVVQHDDVPMWVAWRALAMSERAEDDTGEGEMRRFREPMHYYVDRSYGRSVRGRAIRPYMEDAQLVDAYAEMAAVGFVAPERAAAVKAEFGRARERFFDVMHGRALQIALAGSSEGVDPALEIVKQHLLQGGLSSERERKREARITTATQGMTAEMRRREAELPSRDPDSIQP